MKEEWQIDSQWRGKYRINQRSNSRKKKVGDSNENRITLLSISNYSAIDKQFSSNKESL